MIRGMALSVLVALCACVHSGGKPSVSRSMGPASLALVPADTPYAFGSLVPFDPKMAEKFMSYGLGYMEKLHTGGQMSLPPELQGTPLGRVMVAFANETHGRTTIKQMAELGFSEHPRLIVYGLSVYPVLRMEVGNGQTLRATLLRVLTAAQVTAPEKDLGGQAYWDIESDGVTAIFAIVADELVLGVFPTPSVAEALPYVFGQKKPVRSLKDENRIADVAQLHGFDPRFAGYADLQAVVAILLGEQPSLVPLPASLVAHTANMPASCKQDTRRLVGYAPRIALGYDLIEEHRMSMKITLETIPAISEALASLSKPVPGLTYTPSSPILASFGAGVDVNGAIGVARRAATAILQEPFQCPEFDELNQGAKELVDTLSQALPPFLTGLQGFVLTLDELDLKASPMKIKGGAILVGAGVADLVKMGLSVLGMGSVQVNADGRPVALPLASFGIPASSRPTWP
jgi:hypothetical protein